LTREIFMSKKKNSKYAFLAGIFVIAAVAIGAYALGQSGFDSEKEILLPGKLEIAETQYDFGTISLDNVSHTFMAKNVGEGPLTIEQVSTSCGCTSAQLKKDGKASARFGMDHGNLPRANMTLEPGEETEIVVTYNPLAHGLNRAAGYFNRIVYLKTDNPKKEHELTVTMTVDPEKGKQ
jgi:hypothetical protein